MTEETESNKESKGEYTAWERLDHHILLLQGMTLILTAVTLGVLFFLK